MTERNQEIPSKGVIGTVEDDEMGEDTSKDEENGEKLQEVIDKKLEIHYTEVKSMIDRGLMNNDIKVAMKEKYKVDFTNRQLTQIRKRHNKKKKNKEQNEKIKKRGRPPIFDDERVEELKSEFKNDHDLKGSNVPSNKCRQKLKAVKQIDQINALKESKMPESVQYKYQKIILPKTVSTAEVKNEERIKALNDMYSAVSLVVMAYLIQEKKLELPPVLSNYQTGDDGNEIVRKQLLQLLQDKNSLNESIGRIKPSNYYNFDATSSMVSASGGSFPIRLTQEGKEELDARNISPSIAKKTSKARSVKRIYITTPIGVMPCMIVVIKDRNIKEVDIIPVTDGLQDYGYEVWLALIPATESKKRKQTKTTSSESIALNLDVHPASAAIPVEDDGDSFVESDGGEDDSEDEEILNLNVGCTSRFVRNNSRILATFKL